MVDTGLVSGAPPSLDDVNVNALLIVESLGDEDPVKTGAMLRDYAASCTRDAGVPIQVLFEQVSSAAEFGELLSNVADAVLERGLRPIIHIEAHGGDRGLYFADESCMPWAEFCEHLVPINRALGLRLMVVIAACFGIGLVHGISLNRPAPVFSLVGPTDEVSPAEILGRFRSMYRELFLTLNAGKFYEALRRDRLEQGGMRLLTAISWFDMLLTEYLETHVSRAAIKALALKQHRLDKAAGRSIGMANYKRAYRERLPHFFRSYFEAFFMYSDVEESPARFDRMWNDMNAKINARLCRL